MSSERPLPVAILFALLLAVLVSCSGFYAGILNADANMVFFSSVIRWKPYFWWQDRYGMILPALTWWIRPPLANLITLNILHDLVAWLSFFAGTRYLFGKDNWLFAGTLAIAGTCVFNRNGDLFLFLTTWQIYTPALLFGFLGLIYLEKNLIVALLFLCLSSYANFSIGILLFALLVTRFFEQLSSEGWAPLRANAPRFSGALFLSALFGHYLRVTLAEHHSSYGPLHSVLALAGWVFFFAADWKIFPSSWMIVLGFPLLFLLARIYKKAEVEWTKVFAAIAAGLIYLFIIGLSAFAERNGYPQRYLLPFLIVYSVAWSGPIAKQLKSHSRQMIPALIFLAFLALGLRTGPPSISALQDGLKKRYEPAYAALKGAGCTHVTGDYNRVWDSVFYARMVGDQELWAITERAGSVQDLWALKNFAHPRVCLWADDIDDATEELKAFDLVKLKPVALKNGLLLLE